MAYHLGTVWPHDNGLLAAGFRRYGFDTEARRIVDSVVQASRHFEEARLPELMTGFSREEFDVPVRYPVACHPQAWAAGAVPHMLSTMLGLRPDLPGHRLRLVRPILPSDTRVLEIRGIRLGASTIGFRLHREGDAVRLEPLPGDGKVQVVVESEPDRIPGV
jgi:glycogen debranching enzyme